MAQNNQSQEQDLNQLIKVRYEKLKDLQDNGKDPFQQNIMLQITVRKLRIISILWKVKSSVWLEE